MSNGFYHLVAQRLAEKTIEFYDKQQQGADRIAEAAKNRRRTYEQLESTKEAHKRWRQSDAGKASMARRGKAYKIAHPEKIREKNARYYERHREEINAKRRKKRAEITPEEHEAILARRREKGRIYMQQYRDKHRNDPKYRARRAAESRAQRARKREKKLMEKEGG